MKKSTAILLPALCAAGLLSGFAARRLANRPPDSAPGRDAAGPAAGDAAGKISAAPAATGIQPGQAESPPRHSTDTLETLVALDDGTLYGRLALWLMDASEQDFAAYWESYRGKQNRGNDIAKLVFINWTRLSPRNAIAAVAGSKDEHFAWWAWASHDPQGSLAAAIAANPERVENVAAGIGEFHPGWLRAHLHQIPEAARGNALSGLSKWSDGENPLETLRFLKENGENFDPGSFKALVRKDPWAAFDWIKENPALQTDRYRSGDGPMDILIATMSAEHPDDLERLAARTPSGELKRKMEAALFENLLATDPAAALEQAKAADVPLIAAGRLAKIGLSLVKSDPEQAFEMAKSIFAANPGKLNSETRIEYSNGGSSWGSSASVADELMSALLAKDPARIVEMVAQQGVGTRAASQTFNNLANQWANQDLAGYTDWVNGQADPAIHDRAANYVVSQLTELGQYSEATDWAMSSETMRARGGLSNILSQWQRSDPGEAARWLDSADLPAAEKTRLQEMLERAANPTEDPFIR